MSYDKILYESAREARNMLAAQIVSTLRYTTELPESLRARVAPLLAEHRRQEALMDRALDLPEVA